MYLHVQMKAIQDIPALHVKKGETFPCSNGLAALLILRGWAIKAGEGLETKLEAK
jgi:hypothetical protein